MTVLIILILLIIFWPYIWRWLSRFVMRWMQHKTEDYIRRSMGMPPHDKQNKRNAQTGGQQRHSQGNSNYSRSRRYSSGPIIPKEYAEDVDFNEIHSYSEESNTSNTTEKVRFQQESQVSDAEIIEIKEN